jgi:hypothetical protein
VASSIFLGSGNQITQWNDLSADPTNVTQTNSAEQLSYDATNGLVLTSPGRFMKFDPRLFTSLPDVCAFTLWAEQWSSLSGVGPAIFSARVAGVNDPTKDFLFAYDKGGIVSPTAALFAQVNNGEDGSAMKSGLNLVSDAFLTWGVRWDGALPSRSKMSFRVNGTAVTTDSEDPSSTTTTAATLTQGGLASYEGVGSFDGTAGKIAAIVICRKADYDANIERLEGWAAHCWSQQALLPIGHPYKNAPPVK